ncbi:MAG: hypothetical protein J6U02_02370 [Elusimicrobia bacterium]|nr:hypothetical protein [Elusimicrobiota bacterium]
MKKFFSLAAVLALVCMAGTAFAANAVKTAEVTFGAATLDFSVSLYDWTGGGKDLATYTPKTGADADKIVIDISGIQTGKDEGQWANATTFAKVTSNLTSLPANTSIWMYTKNQTAGTYKANAANNGSYAGLIRAANTATYKKGDHALIRACLVSKADTQNPAKTEAYGYRTTLPDFSTGGISGDDRFYSTGFRYLKDEDDSDFGAQNINRENKILGTSGVDGGLWVGMSDDGNYTQWYANDDIFIFFGVEFKNVMGGDSYGTTTITFGALTE